MARWRKEVEWFADQMERKLRANEHKGTWKYEDPSYLLDRAHEELRELQAIGIAAMDACVVRAMECPNDQAHRGMRAQDVVDEAADVANMVMMLADICARPVFDAPPPPPTATGDAPTPRTGPDGRLADAKIDSSSLTTLRALRAYASKNADDLGPSVVSLYDSDLDAVDHCIGLLELLVENRSHIVVVNPDFKPRK